MWIQSEPSSLVCQVTRFFCLSLTCCFAIACSISTKGSQRVTKQREHQCLSAHLWKRKESNVCNDCQARSYISIFSFSLALDIVLHALYSTSALILPALSFFCSICFLEMRGFIFFSKRKLLHESGQQGTKDCLLFKKNPDLGFNCFSLDFLLLVYEKSIV